MPDAVCLAFDAPCAFYAPPLHHPTTPQAQWRRGLAVTLSTIFGAVLLGLLGLYALRCWRAGRLLGLSSLRGTGDGAVVTGPAGACKPALHHSDSAGSTKLGSSGSSKLGSSGSSKLDASDSGALAIDLEASCGPVPSGMSASRPGPATSPATATRAGSMGRAAALAAPRSALLAQMQSPFEAQAGVEFAAAAAWAAAFKGSSDAAGDRIPAGSGSGLRFSSKFDSALDAVERGGLSAVAQSPRSGKPIQLRPVGSLGERGSAVVRLIGWSRQAHGPLELATGSPCASHCSGPMLSPQAHPSGYLTPACLPASPFPALPVLSQMCVTPWACPSSTPCLAFSGSPMLFCLCPCRCVRLPWAAHHRLPAHGAVPRGEKGYGQRPSNGGGNCEVWDGHLSVQGARQVMVV